MNSETVRNGKRLRQIGLLALVITIAGGALYWRQAKVAGDSDKLVGEYISLVPQPMREGMRACLATARQLPETGVYISRIELQASGSGVAGEALDRIVQSLRKEEYRDVTANAGAGTVEAYIGEADGGARNVLHFDVAQQNAATTVKFSYDAGGQLKPPRNDLLKMLGYCKIMVSAVTP